QQAPADVRRELLANHRVAEILLAETAQLLVEEVAVELGAVRAQADAEARERGLHLVEHLPRAAILSGAAGQVEIREGLGDRAKRRVVRGAGAQPAGAVVHGETAAMDERALGEVGDVRVALTIEMREQTREYPQHEVGRQVQGGFAVATLQSGQ